MTPKPKTDKRQFHRILYKAEAILTCDDKAWTGEIVDLSLKGCLLRFNDTWQENPERLFTLTLSLAEDVAIKMELSAAHVVGNTVGFKCEHIDIESISNLRRLVELNLGDSQLLERDLQALCGF